LVKLSIIIPHFNTPDSLEILLDSIPNNDEIQIIVIDDNSNLEVEKLQILVNSPKYNNITFLTNDNHRKGAGTCRNIGINNAIGEWVLFADADDFFVENFYSYVNKYFNMDLDLVFFTPTSVEVDTGNLSDRHVQKEKILINYLANRNQKAEIDLRYRIHVPWSKLIRKEFIINNNIYFDNVIASNDVMFSTKLGFYMQKFQVSRQIIYCVTKSRGSLTTNTSVNIYDARLIVYINYINYLRSNLNVNELNMLKFNGRTMLIKAFKYRYSFVKIFSVYLKLRKNRIKVFDLQLLDPLFVIKKTIKHHKGHNKQKKYLIK
jgi:glycosyltransferase involved in cell wall biosynthesis